mmetsp:Transcript_51707/g.136659  ORF Transcript_51707/g.136659 Transcript_51707/m.136659 type:complete len:118 (-) Transcript_51707:1475-1828(-)
MKSRGARMTCLQLSWLKVEGGDGLITRLDRQPSGSAHPVEVDVEIDLADVRTKSVAVLDTAGETAALIARGGAADSGVAGPGIGSAIREAGAIVVTAEGAVADRSDAPVKGAAGVGA